MSEDRLHLQQDLKEKQRRIIRTTHSPEETYRLGRILGEALRGGDMVALTGELGSGKTRLTQGIAKGLGISDAYTITSPTFTLVNEYPGRILLYHMDAYRLSGPADLDDMGFEDLQNDRGVVVIEWAERIGDAIPEGTLWINLSYVDESEREIELLGGGRRWALLENDLNSGGF